MTFLPTDVQSQIRSFGARLKQLRLRRGWKLQELAHQSGLSKTFLSRLESGSRQASIAAVLTLARVLEVSLANLFESPAASEPCVIVRRAEAVERHANGLAYVPLSNAARFSNLQPLRVRIPLSRRGNQHYHHDGEEWLYVLSGSVTLSLAGKTYDFEVGDAAHFESRLPHRLMARGKRDAEVLLVASPQAGQMLLPRPAVSQYRAIPMPTHFALPPLKLIPPRAKGRRALTDEKTPTPKTP